MKLIVRGADYGMTDSITDGCLKAIRDGILTDVGLMTNNEKYCERAVKEIKKYPHVSIGQDLNLVSGVPCSNPKDIPSLVDENGIFISSVARKKNNNYEIDPDDIYREMKAQLERFIKLIGKKPAYITGHSLATPDVLEMSEKIKKEYGVEDDIFDDKLPVAKRWYYKNMVVDPNDKKPNYSLDAQNATDVISHIVNNEIEFDYENMPFAVLATHCGYCDGELGKMSTFSVIRGKELEALCAPEVKKWVKDHNIELINYDQYKESR